MKPTLHPRVFAALAAVMLTSFSTSVRADGTWSGGGASVNWSDNNNWGGSAPTYGTLTFNTGGTQGTTSSDNSITAMNKLLWTGSLSWTLNQGGSTVLSVFDNGGTQAKVENQSSGLVTINLPITFAANNASPPNPFGEINAVNANLTFGTGTLTVNGSSCNGIKLFGGSHVVNFNNTVSASGKWFGITTTGTGNTINIGGSFTSSDFYVMNAGTLNLNSGGSLTTSVRLGGDFGNTGNQDQTKSGTFNLAATTGGQTFSGVVNSTSGNTSGALVVNSQNTSGANTLSGHIALDSALKITQSGGGTLNITQAKGGDNTTGTDIKGNTLTLTPATTGTITHSGTIYNSTGTGGVTLTGAGTNIYSAAHTYSGDTLVNAGTLQINSGGSANNSIIRIGDTAANSPAATLSAGAGASFTSTLVVRPSASGTQGTRAIAGIDTSGTATISGGVFMDADASVTNLGGGTLAFTGTQFDLKNQTLTVTIAGNVTMSSATVIQNSTGSGKLIKSGTGTLTLSGANTYTGGTTLNTGGTLNINNATAIGTGTLTIGGSSTTFDNTSGAAITLANNNALTISGGSPTFTGAGDGTHDLNFGTGAVTVGGANRTLTVSAGTLTLGGGVTENGGAQKLTKAGAGTLVLNGAAGTWTGGSEVDAGVLAIGSDTSLGTGSLSLKGGTLQSSGGARSLANNMTLDASSTIAGGSAITINGTLTEAGGSRTLTVNNSALTTIAGNAYLSDNNATSGRGLTVTGTGNLTISGPLANNNAGNTQTATLTKSGSGTLTLGTANTYSGNTTVSAGTLALGASGSINSTPQISIAAGATYDVSAISAYTLSGSTTLTASGTGTVVGTSAAAIKGASGGTVSLGSRPITLTYDGANPALYISQGTLSLNGNAFTVNKAAALAVGTYTIVQQASGNITSVGSYTVSGTAIGAGKTGTISVSGGNVILTIQNTTTTALTRTVGGSPSTYGTSLTFHAVVSPDPGNGSTITFKTNGVSFGTATTTSGAADLTTSVLPYSGGSAYTVTADFGGNVNNAASSGTLSGGQTVNTATLSITASNDTKIYGQTKTYGAGSTAFSSNSLQNGETIGTVTITASGGTATTDGASTYNLTPSAATGGTFTPANYSITYNAGTLTVNPLPAGLSGSRAYDGTTNAAAAILSVTNNVGSDDVTVASGVGGLADSSISTQAITSFGTLALGGIQASNYTLTGASGFVTITQVNTTVTLSSSSNPSGYLDALTFTANVTPTNATGSVTFFNGATPLSTNNLVAGVATSDSINSLPRGTNTITAIYGGDMNDPAATNTLDQVVTNHPPVANNISYYRGPVNTFKFKLSELLTNTSDTDDDTIALVSFSLTTNGIMLTTNGGFRMYSNTNFVNDQLTYTVSDGFGGSATGTITLTSQAFLTGQNATVSVGGGTATVNFAGIPGYNYTVQRSTNLVDWANILMTNAPSGGVFKCVDDFSDLGVVPGSAYYRLEYNP